MQEELCPFFKKTLELKTCMSYKMIKQYFTPNLFITLGVLTNEWKGLVVLTPNNTFCPFRFHDQIPFICFPSYLENYFPTIQSFPLNLVYVYQLPDWFCFWFCFGMRIINLMNSVLLKFQFEYIHSYFKNTNT